MDVESGATVKRSSSDMPAELRDRLETLDAVIVSGIPGYAPGELQGGAGDGTFFPSSTTDVIKVLSEQSVRVDFETPDGAHPLVSVNASDWWMPVAIFIETGATHTAGILVSELIVSLLGRRRAEKSRLHVKIGRVTQGRTKIEWLEAHGRGSDVLKAIREFRE